MSGVRVLTEPFRARTWREVLYAVAGLPLAFVGLAAVLVLVVSVPLVVTAVGLPMLSLTLLAARGLAGANRGLARSLLGEEVASPPPPESDPGLLGWVRSRLRDTVAWRAVAYLVVRPSTAIITFVLTLGFWANGVIFFFYPVIWNIGDPVNYDSQGRPHRAGMQFGDFFFDTWPKAFLATGIGVVLLLIAPWVTHGASILDRLLVRGLIGRYRPSERVRDLERTRAQAVDDSAAQLRRIERDLHDGAQARLVALAMNLSLVKEKLASTADGETRQLVDSAHSNAKEAITELRDLARGIHPPVLDSGLDAALTTLAARSAVPVSLEMDMPVRPSPSIETIAYFCVAELITNIGRHSKARRATIDARCDGRKLTIVVVDDGVGGALVSAGSGLAGLTDRVATVDGELHVDSPSGGPTVVSISLPSHT